MFDPALTTTDESIVTVKVSMPVEFKVSVAVTVSMYVPTGVVESTLTMPVEDPILKPCRYETPNVFTPVPVDVSDTKAGVDCVMWKVVRMLPPPVTWTAGLTVMVS